MSDLLRRTTAVLPDLVTMAVFAGAWVAPQAFGVDIVGTLVVVMLLEFLVMHAGVMIGVVTQSRTMDRQGKTLRIGALGAFYLIFAVGWAIGFGQPWIIASFAWLLLAKVAAVWLFPVSAAAEAARQQRLWGYSALAYLVGAGATLFLPVPRLGMQPDVVAALNLPGTGLWVDEPHRVLAFGVGYFAAQVAITWLAVSSAGRTPIGERC